MSDQDLLDRLMRLGAVPDAPAREEPKLDPAALAEAWPGAEVRTGPGGTLVERAVDYSAEDAVVAEPARLAAGPVGADLAGLCHEPEAAALALGDAVFLDLETTGLGTGAGTYAFLAGLLRIEGNRFRLWQGLLPGPADEPALLSRTDEQGQGAALVVTYNGRRFDLPLLHNRCLMYGRHTDLGRCPHLDLLTPARRLWRPRLGSCTLTRLEHRVLRRPREDDVPGRDIPGLYRDWLQGGVAAPLARIAEHNARDLVALAALAIRIRRILTAPGDDDLKSGADWVGLARNRAALFDEPGTVAAYHEALARLDRTRPTQAELARRAARDLAALHKRSRDFDSALPLWEALCADPDAGIEPWVERAKWLEHREREPARALALVETLLAPEAPDQVPTLDLVDRAELEHRRARLRRKLKR